MALATPQRSKGFAKGGDVTISFSNFPDPSSFVDPTKDQTAAIIQNAIPKSSAAPPAYTPAPSTVPPLPASPSPSTAAPVPVPQRKPDRYLDQNGWQSTRPANGDPNYGGYKKGGRAFAVGGFPSTVEADPWYMRQEDRGLVHPEGMVMGVGGGRTDIHPIQVPAGSYVMPADVVSGLAEGNSMAGSNVIDRMMHSGPFGINMSGGRHGSGPPRAPRVAPPRDPGADIPMQARGGKTKEHTGQLVPIIVAGGEHIIYPQSIIQKFGSLEKGHKILDAFTLAVRKKNIEDTKKLKGPKA